MRAIQRVFNVLQRTRLSRQLKCGCVPYGTECGPGCRCWVRSPLLLWFGPPPAFPSVSSTHRKIEKERILSTGDGRRGKEPNHTTARKPGPCIVHKILLGWDTMSKWWITDTNVHVNELKIIIIMHYIVVTSNKYGNARRGPTMPYQNFHYSFYATPILPQTNLTQKSGRHLFFLIFTKIR